MTRVEDRRWMFPGLLLLGLLWGAGVAVGGANAVFLGASLLGCGLIMADFRIGVVLMILLMPISASQFFPHEMFGIKGLNPFNLLLVTTLASAALGGLARRDPQRRFLPRPLWWLYIVPILVAGVVGMRHVGDIAPVLQLSGSVDFNGTAGYLIELVIKPLFMVLFALLVAAAVAKSERPQRFLMPTLLSVWIMCLLVIGYVLRSGVGLATLAASESREFLSPLGLHANDLGRLYTIAYALLLFSWAETRERGLKWALFFSMGLVVIALMLTFSRGAFFGFLVVNGLFLIWRRNIKTLLAAAFIVALALLLMPDAVYERMAAGFSGSSAQLDPDAVSAGRIDRIWLPLLPEVMTNPVTGHGIGSIMWSEPMRTAPGQVILPVTHPHNAYLQALLDMGVVGLALLGAYFFHVWRGLRSLARAPALRGFYLGAAAGLVSMLISNITDSSLMPRPEQAFLWLAIGMMYGQWRTARPVKAG